MEKTKIVGWIVFLILLLLIVLFVPFSSKKVVSCKTNEDCTMIYAGCCKTPHAINQKYSWIAKIKDFVTTINCKVLCQPSESFEREEPECKKNICTIKYTK